MKSKIILLITILILSVSCNSKKYCPAYSSDTQKINNVR